MNNAISVKGLKKSFGDVVAVDGIDFDVKKGEIFGLLGHNGAGKSTTIECILGVKQPEAGTVEVMGMNPLKERKQIFQKTGVQFQQTGYQSKITVGEICEVTASLYINPSDWRNYLKEFGLADKKKQLVAELSGGERQKLSVILALIPNPELVFLDELTTGLDSVARREVWKHLQDLKKKGLTMLITSHYMDEVQNLCDRICILKKGKIIAIGSVEDTVKKSPYNNLEEAFLWYIGDEEEVKNESI